MTPTTRICAHGQVWTMALLISLIPFGEAAAQPVLKPQLANGGMESADGEKPADWIFFSQTGGKVRLSDEDPYEGERSALIDALSETPKASRRFANLSQTLDAKPWRGKRVRLRAAVKVSNDVVATAAQLWFRVDRPRKGNRRQMGAFDNMQDRPIRDEAWKEHDIVLQVEDDATQVVVGMFIVGRGKAWVDHVRLEEVDEDTPTTGRTLPVASRATSSSDNDDSEDEKPKKGGLYQQSPILAKAFAEAEFAPQQPFFTHWLWLPVIALSLMCLSQLPPKLEIVDDRSNEVSALGWIAKFAFRFTAVYWLLYSTPRVTSLLPYVGSYVSSRYQSATQFLVPWVAENVFKIEDELVPPNGSGDTTYSYIQALIIFVLAITIAIIWSWVDWRKTDYRHLKDLLKSFVRYTLALTMMSYGLAKVAWDMNQFPTPSDYQLSKAWGDSSPMNVVWTFMGASRPYTIFSGLGEVLGGLLLVFRRTSTLGACVVLGVMTNVLMLNYCYDVPVKLYSSHLVAMAAYLLLTDTRRLWNLFIGNRESGRVRFQPSYTGPVSVWIHAAIKVALVVYAFGMPVYNHTIRQIAYFERQAELPEYFGNWKVTKYAIDGKAAEGATAWTSVKFEERAYGPMGVREPTNWISIVLPSGGAATATFESTEENDSSITLRMQDHQNAVIPVDDARLTYNDDGTMTFQGNITMGEFEVVLKKQDEPDSLLMSRGFRWINETPFNR